eukprot:jgi/Orpsp1_1/1174504/evm.model.c7180000050357.1
MNLGYSNSFLEDIFNCEYSKLSIPKRIQILNENEILVKKCDKVIPKESYRAINEFINNNNIDMKSFFICIYAYILFKYSNQDIIYTSFINENQFNVINDDDDNNNNNDNNINIIQPLLIKFENKKFLNEILKEISDFLSLYYKQNILYSDISESLDLLKVNNGIIFSNSLTNFNYDEINSYLLNNCNFDFVFQILDDTNNDNYKVSFLYNDNIYDNYIIESILNCFIEVIRDLDNLYRDIDTIEYIPSEEKHKILNDFNYLKCEYDETKFCHIVFSEIAKKYPERVALYFKDDKYTYHQLDSMSNSLAHTLRNFGLKRNELIGVISNRSPYFIITVLAVMKAGCAYTYIDPEFPKERIRSVLDEANIKFILKYIENDNNDNDEKYKNLLDKNQQPFQFYELDKHNYNENTSELSCINDPDDVLVISFSSGSTGKPKGIIQTYGNKVYNIYSGLENNNGRLSEPDYFNVICVSKFSFGVYYLEIVNSLVNGKTMILPDDNEYNNPTCLAKLMLKYHVDFISCPSSRIEVYMKNELFRKAFKEIKVIKFSGEMVYPEFLKYIFKHTNPEAYVYSTFGLSENNGMCINCCIKMEEIMNSKSSPPGYPACNCDIYIVDKNLNPVPIGVEGELCIVSGGVALGYHNLEELTRSKFIKCPLKLCNDEKKMNKRMLRTGDLCKWTKEGRVIPLGRNDFQIKLRGQKVELNNIENSIKEIKGIDNCIVL